MDPDSSYRIHETVPILPPGLPTKEQQVVGNVQRWPKLYSGGKELDIPEGLTNPDALSQVSGDFSHTQPLENSGLRV